MNLANSNRLKCFVPSCRNTTTNNPTKLFVNVSRSVRKRWCDQLNIKYNESKRMLCCSDHFNLKEDLKNYNQWKLKKLRIRPKLKSTATLRNYGIASNNFNDASKTTPRQNISQMTQPAIFGEESASTADDGECPPLEEELWTDVTPPPRCSECAGAADGGGKLYQCVECPRVVCADCELTDKHSLHCMLRIPSLNVYNIMKDLFESLREAVTTKLVLNDDQPAYPLVEPKTEPIFEDQVQDPLSPRFSNQTCDHNDKHISEENPVKSKQILVTARTIKSLTQAPSTGSPKLNSKVLSAFEITEPTAGTDEWNVTVKRKKEDNGDIMLTQKPLIIMKKKKITSFEVPLIAKMHEPLTTTHKPSTTISHKPSTTISHKPSTTISHKPLTVTVHKPMTTAIDKPLTTTAHTPLTTIVDEPLTVTKHKPLMTVVGKPLATTGPKPLATKVHQTLTTIVDKPLTTIVDKPLTTIVDKPLITIKLEPLETEEIVVKGETEIKVEDTSD